MSLAGQNVLITGGALGSATARLFAQNGASVAYVYHSKPEEADKVVKSLGGGGSHKAYQGDLRTEGAVKAVFEQAKKDYGKLHIAVNNVGKVLKKPMAEISEAEYDEMFALNSKAAFFFIKHAGLNLEDGGKIVSTVTSLLAAFTGFYSV